MYNASTSDVKITGVANDGAVATHFYYWGLNTTAGSTLTLTGSGSFAGAIYAPYQTVSLGGSSANAPRTLSAPSSPITSSAAATLYDLRRGAWEYRQQHPHGAFLPGIVGTSG